jgi:hypothetical protein
MESNERYYARRAVEELRALERAITPEAKARRLALAEAFQLKCQAERKPISPASEINGLTAEPPPAMSFTEA